MVRAPDCLSGCCGFESRQSCQTNKIYAPMVELADTLDLGSSGEIHAGSSPVLPAIFSNESNYDWLTD